MAQVNGNDMDTGHSLRYETPTFDPRGAFAWTLRGGEIARLECGQRRHTQPDPKKLESNEPGIAHQVNGNHTSTSPARRYQTPTFDPRSAFARTLRAGEVALETFYPQAA